MNYIHPKIKQCARNLRKNMTPEERHLWYDFLANSPYRFRRQQAFGLYIVDFFSKPLMLAIELDGSQHFEPKIYTNDLKRTDYLNSQGLHLIRFTNQQIKTQFNSVCTMIQQSAEALLAKEKIAGIAADGYTL